MIDKQNNVIKDFKNMSEAAQYLIDNNVTTAKKKNISTSIGRAVRGIYQTVYNRQ